MQNQNIPEKRRNLALGFSILVVGLLLLGNLFQAIPWSLWEQGGGILLGGIFLLNIAYKFLYKKKYTYMATQVLMSLLALALPLHTFLLITQPNYYQKRNQTLSVEQLFNDQAELSIDAYSDIHTKELNVTIQDHTYNITDSTSDFYYFKMHPRQKAGENAFLAHRKVDTVLKIDFSSTQPQLSYFEKILEQNPTFVFGAPNIPTNIELNVDDGGGLNLTLERQIVQNLTGVFSNGLTKIQLSKTSLPKSKLFLTARGGETDLYLPKEIDFQVKHIVQDLGELEINGQRVRDRGEFTISSQTGQEAPCLIEVTVDSGVARVNLY